MYLHKLFNFLCTYIVCLHFASCVMIIDHCSSQLKKCHSKNCEPCSWSSHESPVACHVVVLHEEMYSGLSQNNVYSCISFARGNGCLMCMWKLKLV